METDSARCLQVINGVQSAENIIPSSSSTFWAYCRNVFTFIDFYIGTLLVYLQFPIHLICHPFTYLLRIIITIAALSSFIEDLFVHGGLALAPVSDRAWIIGSTLVGVLAVALGRILIRQYYLMATKKLDNELDITTKKLDHKLDITTKKLDHELRMTTKKLDHKLGMTTKKLDHKLGMTTKKLDHELGMNDLQMEKHDVDLQLAMEKLDADKREQRTMSMKRGEQVIHLLFV
jgi:hypothetical protein